MRFIILFLSCFTVVSALGQVKLPVIKATSKSVSIRDGEFFSKNSWSLSPTARPDVFVADRSRKPKWVVFYTDIDSIRVKVVPGTMFDFVVLLNGRDSCFTRIESSLPAIEPKMLKNDTIPFTLNPYNAIAIKAVINQTDTVILHLDLSSLGFRLTREGILKKTHLLSDQPEALAGKAIPNFTKLNKVYQLQMGNTVWRNVPVTAVAAAAHETDGRLGWSVFEGKTVEIDYDRQLIIVSPSIPKPRPGYTRSKLEFAHSIPYIKGFFGVNGKKFKGNFGMDTGAESAMVLDSGWAAGHDFVAGLKVLKKSSLTDGRGVKYTTTTVLAPAFSFANQKQVNVPTLILGKSLGIEGIELNFLGNDLLKRFNMILDFKNDEIYFKPNKYSQIIYKG